MYLEHFGFEIEPFEIAPNSHFLYLSRAHKKAFTYLNYALWNKDAFTLLTGGIGSGKTILLQHLLKTMPNTAEVVTLYQTQLSPYELLYAIAEQLGLVSEERMQKPKLFRIINTYLLESKKNVVLIIDEAQSFSRETLEELRLLAGLDIINAKTNINIILCGQPELKQIVESGALEQLNQRIKLRFHLTHLDFNETKEYISFRVQKAGQKLEIFTMDAIKRIYDVTNGLPRLINVIADTALTCGYADGFYRSLGNGRSKVWINGQWAPTIGNICMDMCMVDVTDLDVSAGDEVEIFGDHQSVEELAKAAGTIPYELYTSIGERVQRILK